MGQTSSVLMSGFWINISTRYYNLEMYYYHHGVQKPAAAWSFKQWGACRWLSYFQQKVNNKETNSRAHKPRGLKAPWNNRRRAGGYSLLWGWGNNLDMPQKDRSYWALRKPWRHLICHLSSSLQPISWARLESILRLSLPTYTDTYSLKYDGWGERAHKPYSFNRAWLHLHLQHYHCLAGGSQGCCPYPVQFYEEMQTDVGHSWLHFHSCCVTLIL